MRNLLRALPVALVGLLLVPALSFGATEAKFGANEQVTLVMFIIIFVIILILAIAVWFESRKQY